MARRALLLRTFVLIDRKGIVRRYTPTRLTERDLEAAIALALR